MSERDLCSKCEGNGVVKLHHGVSVCPRCKGECYEPLTVVPFTPKPATKPSKADLLAARARVDMYEAAAVTAWYDRVNQNLFETGEQRLRAIVRDICARYEDQLAQGRGK